MHEGRLKRAAALAGVLLAAPAAAATPREKRPGPIRLGPVFLTPSLRFFAGVDTNVFNRLLDPVSDNAFVLTPAVSYRSQLGRRLGVYGDGILGINYFARQSAERFTNRAGSVTAEYVLGRLTVTGGAGGGQYRDRFSILVDERARRTEERYSFGGRLQLSSRITLTGGRRHEAFRFGSVGGSAPTQLRDALDRDLDVLRVGVERRLTRKTKALALFEDAEERFRVPLTDGTRSVPSRRLMLGVETGRRAAISGQLLAGLRRFPGVGAPEYTGAVFTVEASAPLGIARVALTAQRDVTYTVQTGGFVPAGRPPAVGLRNLYVLRSYRLEASGALPAELVVRGHLGLEQGRALLPERLGSAVLKRGDRRVAIGVSLLRRVGDTMSVGGFVERARRLSNAPGFSYEGWRYGVEASVVP